MKVRIPAYCFGVKWAKQTHGAQFENVQYDGVILKRSDKKERNQVLWSVKFHPQNGQPETIENVKETLLKASTLPNQAVKVRS